MISYLFFTCFDKILIGSVISEEKVKREKGKIHKLRVPYITGYSGN